jgi:hypothetical protein
MSDAKKDAEELFATVTENSVPNKPVKDVIKDKYAKIYRDCIERKIDEENKDGLIGKMYREIINHIPTNPDWALDCAIGTFSVACCKILGTTKIGPFKMNVWKVTIGPSGLANKTNPLKYYAKPTLEDFGNKVEINAEIPCAFSKEGIIAYLSEKGKEGKSVNKDGAMVKDEFSSVFKDAHKGYLGDIMELLSQVYDGAVDKRYTKSAKLEYAKNIFCSLLGATTPHIFQVMERGFYVQGTGNRIDYSWFSDVKIEDDRGKSEKYFGEAQRIIQEQQDAITSFSEGMAKVYNSPLRLIYPMKDAGDLFLEYKYQKDYEANERYKANKLDWKYPYIVRRPMNALKHAGLHCISRAVANIEKTALDTMMINKEDIEWGIAVTEKRLRDFEIIMKVWAEEYGDEEKTQNKEKHSKYDVRRFMELALDGILIQGKQTHHNGEICIREVSAELELPDRDSIGKKLAICLDKEWMRLVEDGELTNEEKKRFIRGGMLATVFRVTEKGRDGYALQD